MSLLMDTTLKGFNNLLASSTPAPGGGSVAALAGVLGSALTVMVVELSTGKKSYQVLDDHIKEKIAADYTAVKLLNTELAQLVDEDTKAFNQVMEAMRLPKTSEEERAKRTKKLENANLCALKVPLEVAGKCLSVLRHQINIAQYGNKNAVSDIGVGALLAFAGVEGAALNVKINLSGITDQSVKKDALQKISSFMAEGEKIKSQIIAIVNNRIEK
ncbi:MAG: cyclodeaminase/cyclohydrolase family protein [Syntrophomonadaceae bacterium]|jgi:formiminotetrahydrofolate cyclodeaminase